ncbi:MAG: LysR family transcriptional regulator, transcriptional activator of the cysJI operon [Hyphomicrobiales bacterium]|nr:LysR family transcriptional regulator, transcriptional activator of the cysJI operon [Hyphomicrobiales bacterium]
MRLVERRSRRLTEVGDKLASHVLRAEAILAQAGRVVNAMRQPELGSLSVHASGTPGTYMLPDVIAKFREACPGVSFDFQMGTSAEVVQAVRSHRAEIGIAGSFPTGPEITAEPLTQDEIVIVGPRAYKGQRVSRDDLESLVWISREDGSGTRAVADRALADLGIVPNRRLAFPGWEPVKLAVRRGYGVAALSLLAVAEELASGTLVVIPFAPWKVHRTMSIVRIRDAALTPAAQLFVHLLRARVGDISALPRTKVARSRRKLSRPSAPIS